MYESLKDWVNIPVTIRPFERRTATGDKIFGEPYDALCYPQGEVTMVRNWQGIEVVSSNQLHVDGKVPITKLDNVIFEGVELSVQAISTYYRNGVPDIKVVYI